MLPVCWMLAGLSALAGGSLEAWRLLPSRKRKASEMSDSGATPPLTHESESAPADTPPQDDLNMREEHANMIIRAGAPQTVTEGVQAAASLVPSAGNAPTDAAGLPPSPAPSCSAGADAASPADELPAAPETEAASVPSGSSLPASPAHSSLALSAGAPASSDDGAAPRGGACDTAATAEAAGGLVVLAAGQPGSSHAAAAPGSLHATPHLPRARTGAPLTSPTPTAMPSGSGGRASGSQPGSSPGQPLSARAHRELKGLESFGWDKQKHKHPVNANCHMGQHNQIIRRLEEEGIDGDVDGGNGAFEGGEDDSADLARRRASKRLKTEPWEEPTSSPSHSHSPSGTESDYDSDPDILSCDVIS